MVSLHPFIDNGITKGSPNFAGGTLTCHCPSDKIVVTLTSNVAHNHACGCSKCWKPAGSLFSLIGVVPRDNLSVTSNPSKLFIVDEKAAIKRNACSGCGVHMYGRIDEPKHPFFGLDFVHVELSPEKGWQEPQFAGFVSSIIEQGYNPEGMDWVREKFGKVGLKTYDVLAPALMDLIATVNAKQAGVVFAKI